MDYGYTGLGGYEVRIADHNKRLLGSGVLFTPHEDKYAYVFTAAHLFWYTDDLNTPHMPDKIELVLTYAKNRECVSTIKPYFIKMSDKAVYEETNLILLHKNYNARDKKSRWDAAVLRISRDTWMERSVCAFHFPTTYRNTTLTGWGYPLAMSNTESLLSGEADPFREGLRFKGEAIRFDNEYFEILLQYSVERSSIDLDGYSGMGMYTEQGLFFGVLSRDAGSEYAGPYVWVTAWKVFWDILDAYGNVNYKQYTKSVEHEYVNLNQQVWWLPKSMAVSEYGLMEDRYSINLQTLLLGMTDPYTVILASVWKNGIGRSLEKQVYKFISRYTQEHSKKLRQHWYEYDEYFPEGEMNFIQGEGIIINLHANTENMYELLQYILKILHQREEEAKAYKLIVNIWSQDPVIAFHALQEVWEKKTLDSSIDFLSAISYFMLAEKHKEVSRTQICQCRDQLRRMNFPEMKKELIMYKNMKTAIWWELLKDMAESEEQEEVLLGYQAAKSYHHAIEHWMEHWMEQMGRKWCLKWKKQPEELVSRWEAEDIDLFCWELYLYQKRCSEGKAAMCNELLKELRGYSSASIENLLDMLLSREGFDDLDNTVLRPEDVARWARTAENEEFQRYLPILKQKKPYYWCAIVNSIYGLEYVLDEVFDKGKTSYAEKILNQKINGDRDIFQEEDVEYIRSLIRRRNK